MCQNRLAGTNSKTSATSELCNSALKNASKNLAHSLFPLPVSKIGTHFKILLLHYSSSPPRCIGEKLLGKRVWSLTYCQIYHYFFWRMVDTIREFWLRRFYPYILWQLCNSFSPNTVFHSLMAMNLFWKFIWNNVGKISLSIKYMYIVFFLGKQEYVNYYNIKFHSFMQYLKTTVTRYSESGAQRKITGFCENWVRNKISFFSESSTPIFTKNELWAPVLCLLLVLREGA